MLIDKEESSTNYCNRTWNPTREEEILQHNLRGQGVLKRRHKQEPVKNDKENKCETSL